MSRLPLQRPQRFRWTRTKERTRVRYVGDPSRSKRTITADRDGSCLVANGPGCKSEAVFATILFSTVFLPLSFHSTLTTWFQQRRASSVRPPLRLGCCQPRTTNTRREREEMQTQNIGFCSAITPDDGHSRREATRLSILVRPRTTRTRKKDTKPLLAHTTKETDTRFLAILMEEGNTMEG